MMRVIILFACLSILFSCQKEKITEQHIHPKYYNHLKINSSFDVFLKQDSSSTISIEADEDMIKEIDLTYDNDTLIISNNLEKNWLKPTSTIPKITIYFSEIAEIKVNEKCFVKSINTIKQHYFGLVLGSKTNAAELEMNCKNFYFWNNFPCGGQLKLKGKVNNIKLWNFALMSIDAKQLTVKNAIIENSSSGDVSVNVADTMNYKIYGAGNVICTPKPKVILNNGQLGEGNFIIE